MKSFKQVSLALVSAGAVSLAALSGVPAWAAGAATPASGATAAAASATARHDFTKLSRAGNRMMMDVATARIALFDGHPGLAVQRVKDAQAALREARKDDTNFFKAESELNVLPGHEKPVNPDTTAKAWLPVGGSVELVDDYKAFTPEKSKALAEANAKFKQGDAKGGIELLRLADVNVLSSLDLAPLEATSSSLDEAAGLLAAEKYYEAGQVLHRIQDSIRISELDVNVAPTAKKAAAAQPKK